MLPFIVRLMILLIRFLNSVILSFVWWMILTVIYNKFFRPYVWGTIRNIGVRLGWLFPLLKG